MSSTSTPETATAASQPVHAPDTDLVLQAPSAVVQIPVSSADSMVKLDPATVSTIDQTVAGFADSLLALDTHSAEFATKVSSVQNLGDKEMIFMTIEFLQSANKPIALPEGVRQQAAA